MEPLSNSNNVQRPADLLHDKRYCSSIESIARELAVPIDDVVARYQSTLATLAPRATVTDYIAILVEKKVKALYRTGYRNLQTPRFAA